MTERKRTWMSRRRRGFTLLEILLVVGLLALLASFAIPALVSQGEKAKKGIAQAAIGPNGTIANAIKGFKLEIGHNPESLKDLVERPSNADDAKKWTQQIENLSGLQDPWGRDYLYNAKGSKNEGAFDLWSVGPDGQDGTDDDVANWKTDK